MSIEKRMKKRIQQIDDNLDQIVKNPYEKKRRFPLWVKIAIPVSSAVLSCGLTLAIVLPIAIGIKGFKNDSEIDSFILAKKISSSEINETIITENENSFLSCFSKEIIENVKNNNVDHNFVFSPISYYLCLSSIYSLCNAEYNYPLTKLGANSKQELVSLASRIAKRSCLYDLKYGSRVSIANYIADFSGAFDQNSIEIATNQLHTAYISNYKNLADAANEFIKELSNNKIETYIGHLPDAGETTFVSGMYIDLLYSLPFFEQNNIEMPFNGKGLYIFLNGETYAKNITICDDYISFEQCSIDSNFTIKYVKPIQKTVSSFFETKSFDSCFENKTKVTKIYLKMPKVEINSSIDFKQIAIDSGFLNEKDIRFKANSKPYEVKSFIQENCLAFDYDGIRAYTATSLRMIPEEMSQISIELDSSYAFEIVGRDNLVLYYGEITAL